MNTQQSKEQKLQNDRYSNQSKGAGMSHGDVGKRKQAVFLEDDYDSRGVSPEEAAETATPASRKQSGPAGKTNSERQFNS